MHHETMKLKEIVSFYVKNNSNICCIFLDATRAGSIEQIWLIIWNLISTRSASSYYYIIT
jgi:hypothetical protein